MVHFYGTFEPSFHDSARMRARSSLAGSSSGVWPVKADFRMDWRRCPSLPFGLVFLQNPALPLRRALENLFVNLLFLARRRIPNEFGKMAGGGRFAFEGRHVGHVNLDRGVSARTGDRTFRVFVGATNSGHVNFDHALALDFLAAFLFGGFFAGAASRSVRMRARSSPAGSSLGSWGMSWPVKADLRMDWRRRADRASSD